MLASLAFAGLVAPRLRVESDLTQLIPAGGDEASRLMTRQIRSGVASSLVLVGLEGADEGRLAATSRGLQARLQREPGIMFAQNGSTLLNPDTIGWLFAHRYLLAPNTTPAAFTVAALHADFVRLRAALASSASPLASQYGVPDPTGALPALLGAWRGSAAASLRHGVWFAPEGGPGPDGGSGAEHGAGDGAGPGGGHRAEPDARGGGHPGSDGPRALLVVRLRAGASDGAAQVAALAALRRDADAAASAAGVAHLRLLEGGAPVFARAAQASVEHDVRLLSVASLLLVTGWLTWRFRSPWMLAAIGVTVPASFAVACLAVQFAFGFVHAITLGFGATMLGITVDYPVLLVGHRKIGEPGPDTIRRIGRAFTLSVLTASLGLSGMIGSSFRGIAQLGLFSVSGILTAAALTGWLLPRLIERAGLAPAYAGARGRLPRLEGLRRFRLWGLLPPALALAVLAGLGGVRLDRDLAALTPVPARLLAGDAALRADLGAPDVGIAALVRADSPDGVLARETALLPALDALRAGGRPGADGAFDSVEIAARLLPDQATQAARQAALPDEATLAARIGAAQAGLGFTPAAFDAFRQAVAAARAGPRVSPGDLPSDLLRSRLDALLFRADGAWYGAVIPTGLHDAAAFRALFAGRPGWQVLDVRAATGRLVGFYTSQAWPALLAGGGLAVLVLLAGTRDAWRVARIVGAIAATLLVTVAVLMLVHGSLSLIELVSLQFVGGIGLDYALFFARTQIDAEERARTLRTLVTCNVMALLTFSLLCLCRTPLLRQIGETVCLGILLALGFAFLFAGPRPGTEGAGGDEARA